MRPRFVGRLGFADAVSVLNAALGFCAVAAAAVDVGLAARVILLAGIADALDGLVARWRGATAVGPHLDSLADVASFGVAPAAVVFAAAAAAWGTAPTVRTAVAVALPALFVAAAVLRLGMYTAYDAGNAHTEGVQSTLAGTVLAAALLAGADHLTLLAATGAFVYLMVTDLPYPDLRPGHAVAMGAVQAGAVLFPAAATRLFPRALLVAALCYLVGAPWLYPRADEATEEEEEVAT